MSELITPRRADARRQLLATVFAHSLLALTVSEARAEDSSRPTVWIEFGGQLSRLGDGKEIFAPSVFDARPDMFSPSQEFEKSPSNSLDEYGKISFRPNGSDWSFSASVRYGRSIAKKHAHQQTYPEYAYFSSASFGLGAQLPRAARFADTRSNDRESHTIVDFTVGKDVGLGIFGSRIGSSTFDLGVRYAQFGSRSNIALKSDPDWRFSQYLLFDVFNFIIQPYHSNAASFVANRSFHGVGPTVSWQASAPLGGDADKGELAFDWGVNAAVLFGRQKARVEHQTTARYNNGGTGIAGVLGGGTLATVYRNAPPPDVRSRSVTVPNVGGFAGLSFRYDTAKVSFGYKADFFFGAMDGGIDTRKTYDRNFYGPFATISIGLGG